MTNWATLRALIIGGDSTVGAALARQLADKATVVSLTSRRGTAGTVPLNLAEPERIDLPDADICYICAAMTNQNACEADPELAWRVNVAAPKAIAERMAAINGRTVFLSSSTVFDGSRPLRRTDETTCPLNEYGRQKAAAEAAVLATRGGIVVRLTKVLTPNLPLFVNWITALRRGERIRAYTDLYFAPIALETVAAFLCALGAGNEAGIYQLSGRRDISFAEAARHLGEQLGVTDGVIETSAAAAGIPACSRPENTTMDSSRAEALLGYALPDPLTVLKTTFAA